MTLAITIARQVDGKRLSDSLFAEKKPVSGSQVSQSLNPQRGDFLAELTCPQYLFMEPLEILDFALLALLIIRPLLNLQSDKDTDDNNKKVKSGRKPVLILDVLVQATQDHLRGTHRQGRLKVERLLRVH
jgi:hypothetical protein